MRSSRVARRYLDRLSEIPFMRNARLAHYPTGRGEIWDYVLHFEVDGAPRTLFVEEKRTRYLPEYLIEDLAIRSHRLRGEEWILFAPYVSRGAGQKLRERSINYLDLAGNCHIRLGTSHMASIDGRRSALGGETTRGIGAAGYRVIFAILVRPALLASTVRGIADAAEASKSGVSLTIRRLEREGLLGSTKSRLVLNRPRALLDRWLVGYETVLRPRLVFGRYSAREKDPIELEQVVERALSGLAAPAPGSNRPAIRWAWGGTAAAYRFTRHYRGPTTVLHFSEEPTSAPALLELQPNPRGEIWFLGVPAALAFSDDSRRTVDPVLVYSEMLATRDDRAEEAAADLYERFLAPRW